MKTSAVRNPVIVGVALAAVVIIALSVKHTLIAPELTGQDARQNFIGLMPSDWSGAARAEKDIQSLAPKQKIEWYVVKDPTDESIVYFASDVMTTSNKVSSTDLSVFRYNTASYEFERIYRGTFAQGSIEGLDDSVAPVFHVLGYDHGNLVILAQDGSDSPGPCTMPLTLGRTDADQIREMLSLNIADPYKAGLTAYTVPEHVLADQDARSQACEEEMEAEMQ